MRMLPARTNRWKTVWNQAVFLFLVPVVGAELPHHTYILTFIILRHIDQTLGNHDRYVIRVVTQAVDSDLYHIEALSVHLMTKCKSRYDFSCNNHLIVFKYLVSHRIHSPFAFANLFLFRDCMHHTNHFVRKSQFSVDKINFFVSF